MFSKGQDNNSSSGGEPLVATKPRLCTLRAGLAREQTDQERSNQEDKEKEESTRKEQEARKEEASGRTPGSWTSVSQILEDPNSSLQAPDIELEAASACHGVWGRLQLRFSRADETADHSYQGGGASSSSSTTTGLRRRSRTAREERPPVVCTRGVRTIAETSTCAAEVCSACR